MSVYNTKESEKNRMAKMMLHEAIARSTGNKAKTILHDQTDECCTLIVQEHKKMKFRWWVIEKDGHVWENEKDRQEFMEHIRNHADPDKKIWLPVEVDEDAIDPEDLLSALQTAAHELGKENGVLATSDQILRQEAQKTLDHLHHVLKQYRRALWR